MKTIKFEFDFDDILIVPSRKTNITSRYLDVQLPAMLPLFAAPMDTVIDLENMNHFLDNIKFCQISKSAYDRFNK